MERIDLKPTWSGIESGRGPQRMPHKPTLMVAQAQTRGAWSWHGRHLRTHSKL
eukprot:CAMPEP_0183387816 /NCGR_PEP_ID=MMETSP0370-20130417/3581_1 /TAXON_ID=268820 /ORGANISM="Peridinium aciculiferum, Strain PAER-2" /LENGTH=52 /DNA_ID=CAMNT_0025566545 /DNA_START=35 /DNA_END=190 /DNA_ORIENTATION=+